MNLRERLTEDLKSAMKRGDKFAVGVIRMLVSAIKNKEIAVRGNGGKDLGEEDIIGILQSEAKKRKEAAEVFTKGGRMDLAEKETKEYALVGTYLPHMMDAGEAEGKVRDIIQKSGVREFGPAMKEVMKELRGKADAQVISAAVKKALDV